MIYVEVKIEKEKYFGINTKERGKLCDQIVETLKKTYNSPVSIKLIILEKEND